MDAYEDFIMNTLIKTVEEIKYTIPYDVLRLAFQDEYTAWRNGGVTLDEKILSKIIRPRVLVDCNLVGGMEVVIPLDGLNPESVDQYYTILKIPSERIGNKTIFSVLSLGLHPYNSSLNMAVGAMGFSAPVNVNSVTNTAQRIGDSVSTAPILANTRIDIIGHNTVLIHEQWRLIVSYSLRCMVANDPEMQNIHPRSILAFSKLCQLAVKSYIYNTMIVKIDQAFLSGGQELGAVKNIIESYADAEELYQTYLKEKWSKVAYMNDKLGHDRFIRLQISPGL